MMPLEPNVRQSRTYAEFVALRRPGRATDEISYPRPTKSEGMVAIVREVSRVSLARTPSGRALPNEAASVPAINAAPLMKSRRRIWRNVQKLECQFAVASCET